VVSRYGGVEVEVNEKGLRGPPIDYTRAAGTLRVLWLGDSVTVGYGLPRWDAAYPYQVEPLLEKATGRTVETVNAAIDGWSPWQHHAWMRREGFRYQPDLVVVGFVLNDVTEKFSLARFGGNEEGHQLSLTTSRLQRLVGDTALGFTVRRIGARLRFGADPQAGARQREVLDVRAIVDHPERSDVRHAWDVTLEELRALFDGFEERGVRAALVVFPYTFQFVDPARAGAPQAIVRRFADERGLAVLDLLPAMADRMAAEGVSPDAWFFDQNHPTERGSVVVAELIEDFLVREELVGRAP
jgi:lysophospholipase L1-like esterase